MGDGDINLIAKIAPKNGAFVGVVDSNQTLSSGIEDNLVKFGATVLEDSGVAVSDIVTTSTALLLDQTTPQTVVNGAPVFDEGISTPKLTNLTTNGLVKTSGNDGTLIVDETNYLTSDSVSTIALMLDQSTPQTFTDGTVTGTGLLKVTSGELGLDTSTYLTSITAHASTHGVGQADTIFPADPNADKFLKWNDTTAELEWADAGGGGTQTDTTGISIDDGETILTTGKRGTFTIPYAGTITAWNLSAKQSGSIVMDIWKNASTDPTVTDTITASAKPTLSSEQFANSSTLTGWTTSVSAGDKIAYNIDSVSTITRVTLTLSITKS